MKLMITDNRGKIPILFIHPWTGFYGAETSLYLLIKYLNREIFQPVVVLPDEGPLWEKLQTLNIPISIAPLVPWFNVDGSASGLLRWLADLSERVRPITDIVHEWDIKIVHSNVADIFEGAIAGTLTGRPHICTVRNNRFAHTWLKSVISIASVHEILSSMSQMIVPVSSAVKEAISPFVAPTKLRVIYNGVEIQPVQTYPGRSSPDTVLPQAENSREPRISSIGRVTEAKGYDLLIDAAALVVEAYPDALFSVFGPFYDKPLYRRLIQQIKRLNLVDNFHFEGPTERVQDQLHSADLLVLSSKVEGMPRVVLEAMSVGKPVVSTRCGGPEDLIVDGTTGYLVPPNDTGALADAIIRVLRDPEQARIMGQKGLERVRHHFDTRHTTEQYEVLYREVLDGWAARPTQDKNDEDVLIGVVLETLGKYGGEFYEMSRFQELKRFEARVKKTLAYKAYKATKNVAGKFRKNLHS